ncbi:amidohydrolase family protein [Granulicella aggregans]|uniref:amidohydrolase family protein n=1 Tax=Granulicella aggregans TaxID=474949 RepID=UPI0021DF5BF7|nr:amidohydrolase family protein [Granulicella aggregans]
MRELAHRPRQGDAVLRGVRYANGSMDSDWGSIQIDAGRIVHVGTDASLLSSPRGSSIDIDLTGHLVLPGLVNAHDHLQFALYPRLGDRPYGNYVEWGEEIHRKFADVIATHHSVPKRVRLWWGGIRNLLCGVTTVCHHDTLWPELQKEKFPVRVVQQYGWSHSVALGGDLLKAYEATTADAPFILHACEGIDAQAEQELAELNRLGVLGTHTVLVHGLALDEAGIDLLREREASLIVCPSSNDFLFHRLPDMELMNGMENLSLGNDSPLTAIGDLLDEIRFGMRQCEIAPTKMYAMVTENPARALRLRDGEGAVKKDGVGDLIAVLDEGRSPAETLASLSTQDVEFVMIGGCVQLASESVWHRLPPTARDGLEPLWIDGTIRWLRAPVYELLRQAEAVLGEDSVRLGGRPLRSAALRWVGA